MLVNYVTKGGPHLASYRLRIASPGGYMKVMGNQVRAGEFEPADVHIFSKHWDYGEQELALQSPCPIFDLCDDWFNREHDAHYRRMVEICHVVTSSERLAERVKEETGKDAVCIPEPYELPDGIPKEPEREPLVLWFGHSSNLPTLKGLRLPRLLICTNAQYQAGPPTIIPYSLDTLRQCLEACDVVVIPQSKDWKSANRLVESLRAGRFCIAADIPAYRGFHQFLGDIEEGLEWLKSGPIISRIISGRNELSSFSPESIGQRWLNFISAAVTRSSGATST